MHRIKRRIFKYLSADPAVTSKRLYEKHAGNPRAFRMHYYNWINGHLKRRCALPSYRKSTAPFSHFQKLTPLVKQALLLGATADHPNDEGVAGCGGSFHSVSVHIVQDWKIFSYLNKERFIGQHVQIDGVTRVVTDIGVIDYPCSASQLDAHMDSSTCAIKIIFIYAYMFYHADFSDWVTKYVATHPSTLIAAYFSDSHHEIENGCSLAFVADYIISSHPDNYQLLSSINPYVYVDKIYLNQWDPGKALEKCRSTSFADRDFSMYGTFNYYPQFPLRNRFVATLTTEYGNTVKLNSLAERASWLAQTGDQTLDAWLRFGITLVVPTIYDFTTRVCDALSAGHAVLVPKGCTWMDSWISLEEQRELGIYRYLDLSADSLHDAYNRALKRETAADCQQRSERRSEFCLERLSQNCLFDTFIRVTRLVLE